ncbi:MAG: energy transducer TonB [Gammaproteobacteria bacterium]|nr:energy transducer TonB [Gammaproteobacteria bacterium]
MIGHPHILLGRLRWSLLLGCLAVLSGCVALTGDGQPVLELSEGAQPVYPEAAKEAGIEGAVTLIYTVTASGHVEDVRVLEAEPEGVFDEAALAAVRTWRYRPLRRGGEPVVLDNVVSTLRFRLAEAYPGL